MKLYYLQLISVVFIIMDVPGLHVLESILHTIYTKGLIKTLAVLEWGRNAISQL